MILGVIAARGGSKGLPGKNLRPLGGVPLIVHTIRAAQACRRLSDFLVTTDDGEIARVAREAGAPVPFLRPSELATDEVSIWPAVAHATGEWERRTGTLVQTVVLLQPTSPLRTGEDIDGCIARFKETGAELCFSVVRAHDSPYFNLVEPDSAMKGFVKPCSPVMRDHARRQAAPPVFAVNGAVYVIRRPLVEELRNQFHLDRIAAYEMPRDRSIDIDTVDDFLWADWLIGLARRGQGQPSTGKSS